MITSEVHESLQHLMVPRAMVIAPYPQMPDWLREGDILTETSISQDGSVFKILVNGENSIPPHIVDCQFYKANFKMLKWWEERDRKVLPNYTKIIDGSGTHVMKAGAPHNIVGRVFTFLPATEGEYKTYTKTKALHINESSEFKDYM